MKLKIQDLAKRLAIPAGTLERWIRQGRIPVYREGETCVFRRSSLERWASVHNLVFSSGGPEAVVPPVGHPALENLLPVMKRGGTFYDIEASGIDSALAAAAAVIPGLSASDREELLAGLNEREQMTSTGIGKGVAIPHPRTPPAGMIQDPLITTCFLDQPLDFSAVDDQPVFVLFVMLSPSIKAHLHLLSRLSFCVRNDAFVEFLKRRPSPDDLLSRIAEFEHRLDSTGV